MIWILGYIAIYWNILRYSLQFWKTDSGWWNNKCLNMYVFTNTDIAAIKESSRYHQVESVYSVSHRTWFHTRLGLAQDSVLHRTRSHTPFNFSIVLSVLKIIHIVFVFISPDHGILCEIWHYKGSRPKSYFVERRRMCN